MSENRVQIVLEGDARSAQGAIVGTAKVLLDLSVNGDKASKSLKDADASTANLGRSTQSTGQALKQTEAATTSLTNSTRAMAAETGKAAAAQKQQEVSLLGAVSMAKNLAAAYGVFKGLEYAKEAGMAVFDAGSNMERLGMSFKGIEGTGDKAAETMTWLRTESDRLGTSFTTTAASYKSFLAAAKTSRMAEQDIRDIFTAVSGAGAVLGMDSQQQARSLMALQQMLSKGTVSAEELRQQLGENLPGAFALAAEAMGVSEAQLAKMMERGEVAATDLLPRLARVLKDTYGDSVKDASDTGTAAAARLGSAWKDLETIFYNSKGITSTLDAMTAAIKRLGGGPGDAVDTIEKMTQRIAALRKQQSNALYDDEKEKYGQQAAELEAKRSKAINDGYIAAGKALPADSWLSFDRDKIEADVRGYKMLEEQAKKTLEARAQVVAAQGSLAQVKAEINGDPLLVELTKIQEGYKKFKADMASKMADKELTSDGYNALASTVAIEGKKVKIQEDYARRSIALDRDKLSAEREVQLASLEGVDAYYADMEAIRKKYAAARLKPDSPDAQWADTMESAELAKRMREQRKGSSERRMGYESDLSKGLTEIYATQSGHSITGSMQEQSQAVEIERQQRVLALYEKQRQAEEAIYEVRRRTGDELGSMDQEELDTKQKELDLVNALLDVTNSLAAVKQQEIATSRIWQSGMRKGFQDYADAASDYASQAKSAVANAFSSMEDALARFSIKSKADWSSLVDTILMDLVKIQLRSSVTGPLSSWMGSILPSANGNVLGGDGISALSGGIYSQPTYFGYDRHITAFANGGVLGEAGIEAVMPLTRDSSGKLGVRAQGGGDSFTCNLYLSIAPSSGNAQQDQNYANTIGETVQSGMDAWWDDKLRKSQRPGAIGNGGMSL